jgi:hypothetical protein
MMTPSRFLASYWLIELYPTERTYLLQQLITLRVAILGTLYYALG